jgi:hypothetical protein
LSNDINKQQRENKEKDKLKKDALYTIVSALINRTHPPLAEKAWPLPKFKIHVQRDAMGVRSYLYEKPNKEMNYLDFEGVVDLIFQFVKYECGSSRLRSTSFTEKEARELAKFWRSGTPSFTKLIKPIAEKSDDSYTFKKLSFDFEPCGDFATECPAFFEFFSRTSNAKAMMAWIGSLFEPVADRQQYVWLYGDGRNGKGSVARVLGSVFGNACTWEQVPSENERRFWTSGLLGKRLAVFDDCSNYGFVSTGFFKSLTGGSAVRVEQKNQPSFSADLNIKFLFLSNEKPAIEGKTADLRRIIFCKAKPITKDFGVDYETKILPSETPKFLGYCIRLYREMTKDTKTIASEADEIAEIISSNEEPFEAVLENNFEIEELLIPSAAVRASEMAEILSRSGLRTNNEQRRFKLFLEHRYNITRKEIKINGKKIYYYDGLSKK